MLTEKELLPTTDYRFCNHHHVPTENHSIVDFGSGHFVANNAAIPLLKALNELGLITRTHHIDENGGFVSIILGDSMTVEIRTVNERDASRTKFNGKKEVLIGWRNKSH